MLGIGMQELLIILVVALIVIGPKRLPELARTLGKGFAEFRKAADDLQETVRTDLERERHEEFRKKYPHLVPEEEGNESGHGAQGSPEGVKTESGSAEGARENGEGSPPYDPRQMEGGEDTEDDTRDG